MESEPENNTREANGSVYSFDTTVSVAVVQDPTHSRAYLWSIAKTRPGVWASLGIIVVRFLILVTRRLALLHACWEIGFPSHATLRESTVRPGQEALK